RAAAYEGEDHAERVRCATHAAHAAAGVRSTKRDNDRLPRNLAVINAYRCAANDSVIAAAAAIRRTLDAAAISCAAASGIVEREMRGKRDVVIHRDRTRRRAAGACACADGPAAVEVR